MTRQIRRIVLTGGPGAGKTAVQQVAQHAFPDRLVTVPESATILFSGGFPRLAGTPARCASQRAIFHVQRELERLHESIANGCALLCDRGTVDGAAYWPEDDHGGFFEELGTTLEAELARYDAVIFFESAAVGGLGIEGGNPARVESLQEAARLDRRLRRLWSQHSRFILVPNTSSFFKKLTFGLASLESIVSQLESHHRLQSDPQPPAPA
ncbi:MAG TPA: hypothetical protein DEA08_22400 [Planctomycetes bacterium]|nr:hypothetical protein [Planctomycetota bacterium]